jgi:hypothetical protein
LNRAALNRLRTLQANLNAVRPAGAAEARYLPATREQYGRVLTDKDVTFSVSVIRASNGEAFMQLLAMKAAPYRNVVKPLGTTDLSFALDQMKGAS